MSSAERLFAALSGVDEDLLEQSEKRTKRPARWLGWGMALAACLAVVFAAGAVTGPADAVPEGPGVPEKPGTEAAASVELPESEGQYHFLQFRMDRKQDAPPFSIFVNEESYFAYERDGVYVISPRLTAEGLPECLLEISWTGTPPAEEARNVESQLGSLYENVRGAHSGAVDSMWPSPWNAYIVWGDNGADWDAAQRLAWVVSDGQEGSFILSASYFTEATEGHGAMFYDMMCTFRPERLEEAPAWREELEETAKRIIKETLPGGASVASIDYSISGQGESASALVNVQYRLSGEEPYECLTLALAYSEGGWVQR